MAFKGGATHALRSPESVTQERHDRGGGSDLPPQCRLRVLAFAEHPPAFLRQTALPSYLAGPAAPKWRVGLQLSVSLN
jgi:hypothetical protein